MPFTNAPTNDTYSAHRKGLMHDLYPIDGDGPFINNQGSGAINVLPIKKHIDGEDMIVGETRNAIVGLSTINSSTTTFLRGVFVWEKDASTVYFFAAVADTVLGNTQIYTATASTGPWTSVNTLAGIPNTPIRFCEFVNDINTKSLVMVDGTVGYVYTSNAAGTQITDVDFPTPHVPFPVFLNARLYLAKSGTADIYCSDLNDPSLWTAGAFITAEVYPDDVQALVKIDNYILAVGLQGSEYFYDAANATGSPLARLDGGLLPFGTPNANSIATTPSSVCLIGSSPTIGAPRVIYIEGLKFKELPCEVITDLLNKIGYDFNSARWLMSLRQWAYFFVQNGKQFYLLNFGGNGTVNNITLVYSFENEMWVEYKCGVTGTEKYHAYLACGTQRTIGGSIWSSVVAGTTNAGISFLGMLSNGTGADLLPFTTTALTSANIYNELRTPYYWFGTTNQKTMSRVGIDYTVIGNNEVSLGYPVLYWDDTGNASTSGTNPAYAGGVTFQGGQGNSFPFISQLGAFRKRMLRVTGVGRRIWKAIEMSINKGQR